MCLFCEIVKGNIPSYKIYEDEDCVAFLDISQATIGHTLIVSKKHYDNIFEIDEELCARLFKVASKLAKKLAKKLNLKGMNVLNNCGEIAGQTINHFHIHLIPRYENDGFAFTQKGNKLSEQEFIDLANKLK